jgi:hypothetical protein
LVVTAARLFLTVAVLGLAAPGAAVAQVQLDPSFGEGGVVHVSPLLSPRYTSQFISQMAAGRDGSSYVLADQHGCPDPKSLNCLNALNLFRYTSAGAVDANFGGSDGSYEVPQAYGGSLALMADSEGRPIFIQARDDRVITRRLTRAGRPDPTFGGKGVVVVRCRCAFGVGAAAGPRGTLTLVQFPDDRGDVSRPLRLYRLRAGGSLDPRFGHGGIAELAYHAKALFPREAATHGGDLYFAGRACCGRSRPFYLTRCRRGASSTAASPGPLAARSALSKLRA